MAKNLDETLQMRLLYQHKNPKAPLIGGQKNAMKGVLHNERAFWRTHDPRVEVWRQEIIDFMGRNHAHLDMMKAKITVYSGINCEYVDLNNIDKKIQIIAHANPKWGHREEGEIFDFVTIEKDDPGLGLEGIDIGKLRILLTMQFPSEDPEGICVKLAGVQMAEALGVEANCDLPLYQMTQRRQLLAAESVLRTVHMIPRWDLQIIPLAVLAVLALLREG